MNNLNISIASTLPTISGNFEDLKNQLQEQLKQYNLLVSEDDVKVARKMATSINKLKGDIAKQRKEIISELTAPLKEFELQAKELDIMDWENRNTDMATLIHTKNKSYSKLK